MKSYMSKFIVLVYCLLSIVLYSSAQNVKDSALFTPMVKLSYSFQTPQGNLVDRFGYNSNVGLDFSIKTKSNFIIGAEGSFFFGDQIKEIGILDSLKNSTGFIINQSGNPSVVRLFERGFTVGINVGMLFPSLVPNKNSGIIVYGGPVFMMHKIKIDDIGHQSAQLVDPYPKGYDRLTAGFGAHEFIGYMYLGNKRMLNFFIGVESTQAFTKSQRSYDYDLRRADTEKRLDILNGIRVGWILPLYKRTPKEFYYN